MEDHARTRLRRAVMAAAMVTAVALGFGAAALAHDSNPRRPLVTGGEAQQP